MNPMPEDPTLAPWRRLAQTLDGFFTARARGILASDFAILNTDDNGVGHLRVHGREGAELEAGEIEARIERAFPNRYTMLSEGTRILASAGATHEIECLGSLYEVRLSLLRNTAEAGPSGVGEGSARIQGGLTNRRYEASFDAGDEGSLPVAFFLLYRIVALRREAYRA